MSSLDRITLWCMRQPIFNMYDKFSQSVSYMSGKNAGNRTDKRVTDGPCRRSVEVDPIFRRDLGHGTSVKEGAAHLRGKSRVET